MRVALRVEVRTLRGLHEGVPNLMRLFSQFQVRASFFFPLGRDLSGLNPIDTWHDRASLGLKALAYGTLMLGPALGQEALRLMDLARDNGHDVGLFGLSPWSWSRRMARADEAWVARQCRLLWDAYQAGDGGAGPTALATPDWQANPALLQQLGGDRFHYSAFTRGSYPYFPVLQGMRSTVPEIPTTLPTVDEMLRQPGVTIDNVHEYLYAESRHLRPAGHVFAVSAEREGLGRLGLMEKLLVMWKGQDGALRALYDVLKDIDPASLPHHQVGWGRVEGGSAYMAMQSVQVPA
ncbi:MAG: hypothetical protein LJE59_04785 [Chromatiaceae bacterium]|nr:hypothetical protein [Chromatiaceae bacterium]